MNFRQLETFLAIVQLGSFTAASARLNATQSAVSSRIHELESGLGVQLFDRTQRAVHLTAKGRELVRFAEKALELASEIRHRIGAEETLSGVVRLGVAELVAMSWLPAFATCLSERYPLISLECDVALTKDVAEHLRLGKLDIAFLPEASVGSEFHKESLGCTSFRWMASRSLGLHHGILRADELMQQRLISLGPGSVYFDNVQNLAEKRDLSRTVPFVCNSMNIVASLTKAGLGISLLSPECYAADIEDGRLVTLETVDVPAMIHFAAAYPKGCVNALHRAVARTARETSTFLETTTTSLSPQA